jgi:hypothetical protein
MFAVLAAAMITLMSASGCDTEPQSDQVQREMQEKMTSEATLQTGMPNIKNFRERKILKDIYELRDRANIVTYTYLVAEMSGKLVYFGQTVGYGIPYSTQYSNPEKLVRMYSGGSERIAMPQSEPNGLFTPPAAEGTWVLLCNPNDVSDVQPVYVEPRIVVSPFKLNTN